MAESWTVQESNRTVKIQANRKIGWNRPFHAIGKYYWDKTIFRDEKELDVPEEMIELNVEFQEEIGRS